jgi:CubicO group peptidase (beta-lactamase class C family)
MSPIWPPGTAYLYHFTTYGFLLGEVIRRITGKGVDAFLQDEIAGPLKLDMWIGLPEREDHRVAPHFRSSVRMTPELLRQLFSGLGIDLESRVVRTLSDTFAQTEQLIDLMTERAGRAAIVPAGNGIGNARSLAKMYAATIGEIDGIRLLSKAAIDRARKPQTDHLSGPPPLVARPGTVPQRFGLGFELPRETVPMLGDGSFGHPGAGGRYAFAHPERGYAVAYICTNLLWDGATADPRWVPWNTALREIADK